MLRVARIDLTSGKVEVSTTPEELIRALLGGRGVNMAYLRWHLRSRGDPRSVDPFAPENPLIFGMGLLSGTIAPNAARFNVTAKSPETLGLGDANCGGFFAAALRKAGFDQLVILGKAARPCYLLAQDGELRLCEANGLWGTTSPQAQSQLRERHGPGTVSAVIGPAGENQVRMASVMTGLKNTAGRCGMGAVMGSKNLKAIAAVGGAPVPIADKAAMRAARIEQTKHLQSSRVLQVLGKLGTPFLYDVSNRLGAIRTRNSQDNWFEDTLVASEIEKYSDKMLACTSCVVHCRHRNTLGGEGPEYSTIGLLGANIGIAPADQVITLNNLVNELGLDASSTGTILAWAMELYQRGLIDDAMTEGPLRFGDYERVHRLIGDIAHRRGFGDVLAESTQAKRFFPPEARDYLIAVKDLPQSDPHDVRYIKSFALGIAVASRGADHLRNRPTLDILRLPDEVRREVFGVETSGDPTAYDGKAAMVAWHDDMFAVADCLGICKFVIRGFNSPHLLGYEELTELVRAATGMDLSPEDLRQAGQRVIDLERLINLELGRTRADDTLPKRYFDDPMPDRATKGHRIERDKFEGMLDEYYAVRGWDREGRLDAERVAELEVLTNLA
ncbi:MAG: aldehyde ferredoxin oxidoreductase family protein [Chloroflexota bacterium]